MWQSRRPSARRPPGFCRGCMYGRLFAFCGLNPRALRDEHFYCRYWRSTRVFGRRRRLGGCWPSIRGPPIDYQTAGAVIAQVGGVSMPSHVCGDFCFPGSSNETRPPSSTDSQVKCQPVAASGSATSGGIRIALAATRAVAATPMANTTAKTEIAWGSTWGAGTPNAVL